MRIDNIFRNEDGWFIIVIWDTWMNNLKVEILFHLAFRWSIMQLGLWPTLIFSISLYFLVCYFDVIKPQRLYDTCALMKYGPHVCSSASFLILLVRTYLMDSYGLSVFDLLALLIWLTLDFQAYLSLPDGLASALGLVAMMTDYYNVLVRLALVYHLFNCVWLL